MTARQFTRRPPTRNGGTSWGRFPSECGGYVTYRLFRRDYTGRLRLEERRYYRDMARRDVARALRIAKRLLRERVDEFDLAGQWGIAA